LPALLALLAPLALSALPAPLALLALLALSALLASRSGTLPRDRAPSPGRDIGSAGPLDEPHVDRAVRPGQADRLAVTSAART